MSTKGMAGRPLLDVPEENRFGQWLRRARRYQEMTGEQLAEKIGGSFTQGRVSSYERGAKSPSRETVLQLAQALGADESEALLAAGFAPTLVAEPKSVYLSSDPLLAYGVETDPAPYLYALTDVKMAAAGDLSHNPLIDAPGEDMTHRWRVRAIRIVGSCMEPFLREGDVALVLPPEAVYDRCVVTATVDLQHNVCKRVRIEDGKSWLEPLNGEGEIPEERFVITGVVADRISPLLPPRESG